MILFLACRNATSVHDLVHRQVVVIGRRAGRLEVLFSSARLF